MTENWKDVKGYEGIYQVSDRGNVRSLDMVIKYKDGRQRFQKGKILRPGSNMGYPRVNLCKDGIITPKLVHRLLAEAFLPNPELNKEVNHIDGNKSNCTLENLEWVTPSENMKHAFKTGLNVLNKPKVVTDKICMCDDNMNVIRVFSSQKEAAIYLGKSPSDGNIRKSIKEKRKAYGYWWKYA